MNKEWEAEPQVADGDDFMIAEKSRKASKTRPVSSVVHKMAASNWQHIARCR